MGLCTHLGAPQVGLKYFEDLRLKIPRSEVAAMEAAVREATFQLVGGRQPGASSSAAMFAACCHVLRSRGGLCSAMRRQHLLPLLSLHSYHTHAPQSRWVRRMSSARTALRRVATGGASPRAETSTSLYRRRPPWRAPPPPRSWRRCVWGGGGMSTGWRGLPSLLVGEL